MIYCISDDFSILKLDKSISIDRQDAIAGISRNNYNRKKDNLTIVGTTTFREIYEEDVEDDDKALLIDDSYYEIDDRIPFSLTKGYVPVSSKEVVRVATRVPLLIALGIIVLIFITTFCVSHHSSQKDQIFSYVNSEPALSSEVAITPEKATENF